MKTQSGPKPLMLVALLETGQSFMCLCQCMFPFRSDGGSRGHEHSLIDPPFSSKLLLIPAQINVANQELGIF